MWTKEGKDLTTCMGEDWDNIHEEVKFDIYVWDKPNKDRKYYTIRICPVCGLIDSAGLRSLEQIPA